MAATFTQGERVLCYHGPLVYEAKILKVENWDESTTKTGLLGTQYLVHYKGWKQTCVTLPFAHLKTVTDIRISPPVPCNVRLRRVRSPYAYTPVSLYILYMLLRVDGTNGWTPRDYSNSTTRTLRCRRRSRHSLPPPKHPRALAHPRVQAGGMPRERRGEAHARTAEREARSAGATR